MARRRVDDELFRRPRVEQDELPLVLRYMELRQIRAFRVNSGMVRVGSRFIRLAPAGTPDVLGFTRKGGLFVAGELKDPQDRDSAASGRRGEQRRLQQAFLDDLNAAGGIGIMGNGLEDFVRQLDARI